MKYSCSIVRDLMPLVYDEAASMDSANVVHEHMKECADCSRYYESIKQTAILDNLTESQRFNQQRADSLKKIKKKNKQKLHITATVGIVIGVVIAILTLKLLAGALGIGLLVTGSSLEKVEVSTNISDYNKVIGENHLKQYNFEDFSGIFPQEITRDAKPLDYKFVYYNPWDEQYVTYLTLRYSDSAYSEELERLSSIGVEQQLVMQEIMF